MLELKEFDRAIELFREVRSRAPGEPQSYLDLGLSLFFKLRHNNLHNNTKKVMLEEVIKNLAEVLNGRWASRFSEIEWIANIWLNWVVNYGEYIGLGDMWPNNVERNIFQVKDLQMDIVVSMGWDTDRTDIDLHIYEPSGYHVYYGDRKSTNNGYLSRDFTQGYGPECYVIKESELGVYEFTAKYFASHQSSKDTGTTSSVIWSVKNFGEYDKEDMQFKMVRLEVNKSELQVFVVDTTN